MTAARVKSTGRGGLRFVVCIEGVRWRFVNYANDVSDNDNNEVAYLGGLDTKGWVFGERLDLIAAKIESEAITVRVADLGGRATVAFDARPTYTNYLSADLTDTDETVNVLSTTNGFPDQPQGVYIGFETLLCDGKTATTIGGPGDTTRGYYRSLPTYHYVFDGSTATSGFTPVTDRPLHFEGRRVEFFAYDIGETIDIRTTTGAGDEPFWTGIISTEPEFDGAAWSFTVDPITSRLKQKLGAHLGDPVSIRGIYYPASAPFAIRIDELTNAGVIGYVSVAFTTFAMSGFWETQEDFVAALNVQLAAMMSGASPGVVSGAFTQSLFAKVNNDGTWSFAFSTGGTPHWMQVQGYGPSGAVSAVDGIPANYVVGVNGTPVGTVSASSYYEIPLLPQPGLTGGGTVPRAYFGHSSLGATVASIIRQDARRINVSEATFPSFRIYLSGDSALVSGRTSVAINWDSNGSGLKVDDGVPQTITDSSDSGRYVTAQFIVNGDFAGDPHGLVATALNKPDIKLGIDLGSGTLKDLLDNIISLAPQWAPLGAVPSLRSSEVQTTELVEATASSQLALRKWVIFQERDLEEVVQQECRLLGVVPTIGNNGQIAFRRLRFATAGESADVTLTESDFLHDHAKFYKYQRSPYGLVNLWTLKTGYKPKEDDWLGDTVNVLDRESRSNSGRVREMTIKPYSSETQDLPPAQLITEAQRLASNILGVFGGPYKIMTCRVPLTRFTVKSGDRIKVTWAKPPAGDGSKGVTAKIGIVFGRAIHPRAGYIELTILLTDQRVAGYTPCAFIDSISGVSGGTTFTVTPSPNDFPTSAVMTSFWQTGDKIRVFKFNNSTPGIVTGTVTSVASTTVSITTDAAWNHSGSSWFIDSQVSTSVSSSKQKQYAYIATATALADFSDEDLSPYTFA